MALMTATELYMIKPTVSNLVIRILIPYKIDSLATIIVGIISVLFNSDTVNFHECFFFKKEIKKKIRNPPG
jgi:hypothetical protein